MSDWKYLMALIKLKNTVQFSQEFRIASPGGERLDYIAGVFYQNGKADVTDQVFLGSFLSLAGPPSIIISGFLLGS